VDPVPDPLLLIKSGSVGNRTRISGFAGRNCDHQPTEAVQISRIAANILNSSSLKIGVELILVNV
jgi:hypothetical protein